uniref:Uncharacterized protein n=1 Tax=uncultured Desulfobacterium sp. TaxID=201089 RepID=E1Y8P1_9BACT|nr:unknown protein [uncultured Desulfobacterium sp.]
MIYLFVIIELIIFIDPLSTIGRLFAVTEPGKDEFAWYNIRLKQSIGG